MVFYKNKTASLVILSLLLSACGGGGGGDSSAGGGSDGGGGSDSGSGSGSDSGTQTSNYTQIAFDLRNASTLVTTEKAFSQSQLRAELSSGGNKYESLPSVQFHEFVGATDKQTHSTGSGSTNLFSLGADGALSPVVTSDFDANFSFTVKSPDGKHVYAALDWSNYYTSSSLVREENCAIFKITIADNSVSCLVEGLFAEAPWGTWWKEVNDGRYKPIQFDSQNNVYFLSRGFTVTTLNPGTDIEFKSIDYSLLGNSTLVRVDSETGKVVSMTSDADRVNSFVVTAADALVYRTDTLNMIPNVMATSLSTVTLTEGTYWTDGYYATDDNGTVIYRDNLTANDDISIARASDDFEGGIEKRTIKSYRPDSLSWSNRVIVGDDGYIYSMYATYEDDSEGDFSRYEKMQRILPYAAGEVLAVKIPDLGYWKTPLHVSKGNAYYVEEQTHPAYGQYDIVGVQPLSGESATLLFGDALSDVRLDIETWKLSGDTIYFTGLNNAKSTMVSGTIDVKALAEGRPQSEYLVLGDTASVSEDVLEIRDLELLVSEEDRVNVGAPEITHHIQPQEEVYASTIEFNHWMDIDSVSANMSVTERDQFGGYVEDVDVMPIWLGKVVHLIYDTASGSGSSSNQPLKFGTDYQISFGGDGRNLEGVPLSVSQSDSERTFDWSTRIEKGLTIVDAEADNYGFTTGKAINVFGTNVKIPLIDREREFDHKLSLVSALNENWELAFHTTSSEWKGYIKYDYLAITGSLHILKHSDNISDDRDWLFEDPKVIGSVVKMDAELVENNGKIVFSLKITDEAGDTYDVSREIDHLDEDYSLTYTFDDNGFGAEYRSILDNILLTNSDGTTTYIDENFDNYELGSGDYIGGIGVVELVDD
ncbi:hypothetical protein [Enterovibrio calviensis]|uniref:hypothetical protein n=1 Tax=Enterovibrio calviensis TaxID=91359 RepID=UPI0004810240|nr:hypothetical protein [Enterovibrio calviensis]